MATNVPQVFLDANIVIAAGKPPAALKSPACPISSQQG